MSIRNTVIAAGVVATVAVGVSAAFVDHGGAPGILRSALALKADEGVPQNLVTALKADEGVPQNLVTALKADEGVPQNLVTAMKADEGVPQNLVSA
jgi:hypothetical protein